MTKLIRFKDWIFDADEIVHVGIKEEEGGHHSLNILLKNGRTYELICSGRYDAEYHLDKITITSKATDVEEGYNHFLIRRINLQTHCIRNLETEIKKLMKSFSKAKNKIEKDKK